MNRKTGRRTPVELVKRYTLFIISLFFAALGVALSRKADLGMSPISSVPNIMSLKFQMLTMGNWLIVWNCILILGQILLLRKKFQMIQLLQLPLSILFGYFTDFAIWLVSFLEVSSYFMRLLLVFAGILLVALSVFFAVTADVVMNSAEAFVKAVTDTIHKDFPKVKTVFDVSCVVLSVGLSLLFFDFKIVGTREGTVMAALFTGTVVGVYTRCFKTSLVKLLRI